MAVNLESIQLNLKLKGAKHVKDEINDVVKHAKSQLGELENVELGLKGLDNAKKDIEKLNNTKISLKIDHTPLNELNKHLDEKQKHIKQVEKGLNRLNQKTKYSKSMDGRGSGRKTRKSSSGSSDASYAEINSLNSKVNRQNQIIKNQLKTNRKTYTKELKKQTKSINSTIENLKYASSGSSEIKAKDLYDAFSQALSNNTVDVNVKSEGPLDTIINGILGGIGEPIGYHITHGFEGALEENTGTSIKSEIHKASNVLISTATEMGKSFKNYVTSKAKNVGTEGYISFGERFIDELESSGNLQKSIQSGLYSGFEGIAKELRKTLKDVVVDTATLKPIRSAIGNQTKDFLGDLKDVLKLENAGIKRSDNQTLSTLKDFQKKYTNYPGTDQQQKRDFFGQIGHFIPKESLKEIKDIAIEKRSLPRAFDRADEILKQQQKTDEQIKEDLETANRKAEKQKGKGEDRERAAYLGRKNNIVDQDTPNLVTQDTKEIVISTGGLSTRGSHPKSDTGHRIAADIMRREGNVIGKGVRNPDTDLQMSKENQEKMPLQKVFSNTTSQFGFSLAKPNIRGFNKDSVEMAAQAIAAKKKNPEIKIRFVGESAGGFAAQEATEILNRAGYGDDVSGIGVGTPNMTTNKKPKNQTNILSRDEMMGHDVHNMFAPNNLADVSAPEQNLRGVIGHEYENYREQDSTYNQLLDKEQDPKEISKQVRELANIATDPVRNIEQLPDIKSKLEHYRDVAQEAQNQGKQGFEKITQNTNELIQKIEDDVKEVSGIALGDFAQSKEFGMLDEHRSRSKDNIKNLEDHLADINKRADVPKQILDNDANSELLESIEKQRQEIQESIKHQYYDMIDIYKRSIEKSDKKIQDPNIDQKSLDKTLSFLQVTNEKISNLLQKHGERLEDKSKTLLNHNQKRAEKLISQIKSTRGIVDIPKDAWYSPDDTSSNQQQPQQAQQQQQQQQQPLNIPSDAWRKPDNQPLNIPSSAWREPSNQQRSKRINDLISEGKITDPQKQQQQDVVQGELSGVKDPVSQKDVQKRLQSKEYSKAGLQKLAKEYLEFSNKETNKLTKSDLAAKISEERDPQDVNEQLKILGDEIRNKSQKKGESSQLKKLSETGALNISKFLNEQKQAVNQAYKEYKNAEEKDAERFAKNLKIQIIKQIQSIKDVERKFKIDQKTKQKIAGHRGDLEQKLKDLDSQIKPEQISLSKKQPKIDNLSKAQKQIETQIPELEAAEASNSTSTGTSTSISKQPKVKPKSSYKQQSSINLAQGSKEQQDIRNKLEEFNNKINVQGIGFAFDQTSWDKTKQKIINSLADLESQFNKKVGKKIDWNELIGVYEDTDYETLKKAYEKLVERYHPDYAKDKKGDPKYMESINKAFQMGRDKIVGETQENIKKEDQKKEKQIPWHEMLGVDKNIGMEELKSEFRKLAKQYHPDVGGDEKTFNRLQQAYEIGKKDIEKRQKRQKGLFGGLFGGKNKKGKQRQQQREQQTQTYRLKFETDDILKAKQHWQNTSEFIQNSLKQLADKSSDYGYKIQRNISEGSPGITKAIRTNWDKTKTHLISAFQSISKQSKQKAATIQKSMVNASKQIGNKSHEAIKYGFLRGTNEAKSALTSLQNKGALASKEIKNQFVNNFNEIQGKIKTINNSLQMADFANNALDSVENIKKVFQDIQNNTNQMDISHVARESAEEIRVLGTAAQSTARESRNAISGLENYLRNIDWGELLGRAVIWQGTSAIFENFGDKIRMFAQGATKAFMDFEQMKTTLSFVTSDAAKKMEELKNRANELGVGLEEFRQGYKKLSSTFKGTDLEGKSQEILEGFATASSALQISQEKQKQVFTAISQMASKGVVSAEELRQQLGEHLPLALRASAEAMGMTLQEFNKLLESGNLMASDLLPKLSEQLKIDTAEQAAKATDTFSGQLQILNNKIQTLLSSSGEIIATVGKPIISILNQITGLLTEGRVAVQALGGAFVTVFAGRMSKTVLDFINDLTGLKDYFANAKQRILEDIQLNQQRTGRRRNTSRIFARENIAPIMESIQNTAKGAAKEIAKFGAQVGLLAGAFMTLKTLWSGVNQGNTTFEEQTKDSKSALREFNDELSRTNEEMKNLNGEQFKLGDMRDWVDTAINGINKVRNLGQKARDAITIRDIDSDESYKTFAETKAQQFKIDATEMLKTESKHINDIANQINNDQVMDNMVKQLQQNNKKQQQIEAQLISIGEENTAKREELLNKQSELTRKREEIINDAVPGGKTAIEDRIETLKKQLKRFEDLHGKKLPNGEVIDMSNQIERAKLEIDASQKLLDKFNNKLELASRDAKVLKDQFQEITKEMKNQKFTLEIGQSQAKQNINQQFLAGNIDKDKREQQLKQLELNHQQKRLQLLRQYQQKYQKVFADLDQAEKAQIQNLLGGKSIDESNIGDIKQAQKQAENVNEISSNVKQALEQRQKMLERNKEIQSLETQITETQIDRRNEIRDRADEIKQQAEKLKDKEDKLISRYDDVVQSAQDLDQSVNDFLRSKQKSILELESQIKETKAENQKLEFKNKLNSITGEISNLFGELSGNVAKTIQQQQRFQNENEEKAINRLEAEKRTLQVSRKIKQFQEKRKQIVERGNNLRRKYLKNERKYENLKQNQWQNILKRHVKLQQSLKTVGDGFNKITKGLEDQGNNLLNAIAQVSKKIKSMGTSASSVSGAGSGAGSIENVSNDDIVNKLYKAITNKESGGNPQAINKDTGAIGLGQLMPGNVAAWSEQVLGRVMNPDEFLDNPDKQKQIIKGKLRDYFTEALKAAGGDKDEAIRRVASRWYSGQGDLYNKNTDEGKYPSIAEYTKDILNKVESQIDTVTTNQNRSANGRVFPVPGKSPNERLPGESGMMDATRIRNGRRERHGGIDYQYDTGTPLQSPISGTVQSVYSDKGEYGVKIRGENNGETTQVALNHLSEISDNLKRGAQVEAGQQIGKVGGEKGSWGSSGAHLDLKVKVNGEYMDPRKFFAEKTKQNVSEKTKDNIQFEPLNFETDDGKSVDINKTIKDFESLDLPKLDGLQEKISKIEQLQNEKVESENRKNELQRIKEQLKLEQQRRQTINKIKDSINETQNQTENYKQDMKSLLHDTSTRLSLTQEMRKEREKIENKFDSAIQKRKQNAKELERQLQTEKERLKIIKARIEQMEDGEEKQQLQQQVSLMEKSMEARREQLKLLNSQIEKLENKKPEAIKKNLELIKREKELQRQSYEQSIKASQLESEAKVTDDPVETAKLQAEKQLMEERLSHSEKILEIEKKVKDEEKRQKLKELENEAHKNRIEQIKQERQEKIKNAKLDKQSFIRDQKSELLKLKAENTNNPYKAEQMKGEAEILKQKQSFAKRKQELEKFIDKQVESKQKAQKLRNELRKINEMKLEKIRNESNLLKQDLKQVATRGFNKLFDSFAEVIKGTKSMGDAFKDFATTVLNQIAKIATQRAVAGIVGAIFGGGGFANGGQVGGNFASGGKVENFMSGGMAKAMQKEKTEGGEPVPIVASKGEHVLSKKSGDADFYRKLKSKGIWDDLKTGNYSHGGAVSDKINDSLPISPVSQPPKVKKNNQNNNNVSGGISVPTTITVVSPNPESYRKSKSQIAYQQERETKRAYERFS